MDFICSKVLAGSTPQGILDDVQMVSNTRSDATSMYRFHLLDSAFFLVTGSRRGSGGFRCENVATADL